ncbi:hypothetical protein FAUST_4663 [Fusarium austroamericanum]|uniref:CBM-cenC domain-containing protein n=1 Tax=Fusarium austroamericanum TaxID=282268 RepID=A0AAN6C2K5_FUSAU|nr:hypothetical protein FAUST_4663 [Fusarium austroamericanum]
MARHGIVALLAATLLGAGVNAGPCKPYSSVALSSTVIVEPTMTGSSTITADITDTTDAPETTITDVTTDVTDTTEALETTVTEPATETTGTMETSVIETTAAGTTDLVETTATETAIDTTGTLETTAVDTTNVPDTTITEAVVETSDAPVKPTSTAAAPPAACVPSQILANPSFDDNNSGSPWQLGPQSDISQSNPRSQPNFIYNTIYGVDVLPPVFVQRLPALGSSNYRLQYWFNLQTGSNGNGFSCKVIPSINTQVLYSSSSLTGSDSSGFKVSSQTFRAQDPNVPVVLMFQVKCEGNFNRVNIGIDDITLTRQCNSSDED